MRDADEVRRAWRWRRGGKGDVDEAPRRERVTRVIVSSAGIAVDVANERKEDSCCVRLLLG